MEDWTHTGIVIVIFTTTTTTTTSFFSSSSLHFLPNTSVLLLPNLVYIGHLYEWRRGPSLSKSWKHSSHTNTHTHTYTGRVPLLIISLPKLRIMTPLNFVRRVLFGTSSVGWFGYCYCCGYKQSVNNTWFSSCISEELSSIVCLFVGWFQSRLILST